MDTENGKFTAELVEALDNRELQIQNASLVYSIKSPDERVLIAKDIFKHFDESVLPGKDIRTFVPIADRPGISIEALIEFPTVKNSDKSDLTYIYRWTNELVIRARANDGLTEHDKPNFTLLGRIEFNGSEPAIFHTGNGHILFGEPGFEEVIEIIDQAVFDVFEKNEEIRKKIGHNVLAAKWEKICSEVPVKNNVFDRIKKRLIGNRPE